MINETTTYPVTIPSSGAAFLSIVPNGSARVATCQPAAFVQGSGLPVLGHIDLDTHKALAQIPSRDVVAVMTVDTGFRTWSPPV